MRDFETGHIEETGQEVQYRVRVIQESLSVPTMGNPSGKIPGLRRVELEMRPVPGPLGATQTLILADGRKLRFFTTGFDRVQATGGFF